MADPKFTAGEAAKITWLIARMAKRGLASQTVYQGDLEARVEKVIEGARKREEQQRKSK
ncbi:DUF6257 family protein [Streptomyces erythrochromogenes]|uniref:DUF6257 family protein n=1 Tax=Streptomyces erythrochromogenes TaxID=285574 RepID=UPI00225306DF|nr:DUF6257 family protein [Streptomyces erythrochromogenes]MCX5586041.1 DUF6257 family protein [Streptomyces erythrochromogenes]